MQMSTPVVTEKNFFLGNNERNTRSLERTGKKRLIFGDQTFANHLRPGQTDPTSSNIVT